MTREKCDLQPADDDNMYRSKSFYCDVVLLAEETPRCLLLITEKELLPSVAHTTQTPYWEARRGEARTGKALTIMTCLLAAAAAVATLSFVDEMLRPQPIGLSASDTEPANASSRKAQFCIAQSGLLVSKFA